MSMELVYSIVTIDMTLIFYLKANQHCLSYALLVSLFSFSFVFQVCRLFLDYKYMYNTEKSQSWTDARRPVPRLWIRSAEVRRRGGGRVERR